MQQLKETPLVEGNVAEVVRQGEFLPRLDHVVVEYAGVPMRLVGDVVYKAKHGNLSRAEPLLLPHPKPMGELEVGSTLKVDGDVDSGHMARSTCVVVLFEFIAVEKGWEVWQTRAWLDSLHCKIMLGTYKYKILNALQPCYMHRPWLKKTVVLVGKAVMLVPQRPESRGRGLTDRAC